jgi:hypothetical protein
VRIQGSGDGSFDVYRFNITDSMLVPPPLAETGTVDTSQFYTAVDLVLNGSARRRATPGSSACYRNYTHVVQQAKGLLRIANALLAALLADPDRTGPDGSRYADSYVYVDGLGVHLFIQDPQGFNLRGVPVDGIPRNGLTQEVEQAGTVTRTTSAKTATDGLIQFVSAQIVLSGPVAGGETWTLRIGGVPYSYSTASGDDVATVAGNLVAQIGGASAGPATGEIDITGLPFTVEFSVSGAAPAGTATIRGTPVAGQVDSVPWTEARVTIPSPARYGETWAITLRNADGSGSAFTRSHPVAAGESATDVATALAGAINNHNGFSAQADGAVIVITRTNAFTAAVDVTPAGSGSVTPVVSKVVELNASYGNASDAWVLALTGGTVTAYGTDLAAVAGSLAGLVNGISGYTAVVEGQGCRHAAQRC